MIFVQTAATIALLLISSIGPGLFFIRYLRWRPLETLCASVALSFLLLYLTTFSIYILGLPPAWAYVPTVGAVVATLVCAADLRRLWRHRETRVTMLAFVALVGWLLMLLLLVRNYSGSNWYGDWLEHYERSLFFSEHKPLDTRFLNGLYILPARPPMMNLLAAAVFWQVSPSFEVFQIVFAYLNALVIVPCALIAPSLVAKTRNRAWLISGFLALSPMFVQNATYTWTKEFAAFYALSALGLYLSAWRRNDMPRMVTAFACLAAGALVHYSAAPMILFVAGHYLIVPFRRRTHRWRELIGSAAVSAAILATWLGWSLCAYGWKDTFASNTTVTASQQLSLWGNVSKIAQNTFNTIVPFFFRGSYVDVEVVSPQGMAYLRDWCFPIYQNSFPAMLGLGGLTIVGWLLAKLRFHSPDDPWQHRYAFWLSLIVVVTLAGIAVHGEPDYVGVAHICLQPIALLGLSFAAVGLPHVPHRVRDVALVGLMIDAGLGIFLHFHLLRNDFGIARDGSQIKIHSHLEMGWSAIKNGYLKFNNHLTFLGDHAVDFAGYAEIVLAYGALGICVGLWYLAERGAPSQRRVNRY